MTAYDDHIAEVSAKALADTRPKISQEDAAAIIARAVGPDAAIQSTIDLLMNEASRDHSQEKIDAIKMVIATLRKIDKMS